MQSYQTPTKQSISNDPAQLSFGYSPTGRRRCYKIEGVAFEVSMTIPLTVLFLNIQGLIPHVKSPKRKKKVSEGTGRVGSMVKSSYVDSLSRHQMAIDLLDTQAYVDQTKEQLIGFLRSSC